MRLTLASNQFLDGYVSNYEISLLAGISQNAYKGWKNVVAASYSGTRAVFLYAKSLPPRHAALAKNCTDLSGCVLAGAFCSFTGLASSHLTRSNNSNLYEKLEIKQIGRLKFVNLKKLYDDLGLPYDMRIYIEKCKYFSPAPLEKRVRLTPTLCLGYY